MIKLKMKDYNVILIEKQQKYQLYLLVKLTYSSLSKAIEKEIKTIEDQGEKQINIFEEHRKTLVEYSDEKESSKHSKREEMFE